MVYEYKSFLVDGLEHDFCFSIHIGNFIIPMDELIFFRGVGSTTNQTCEPCAGQSANGFPLWRRAGQGAAMWLFSGNKGSSAGPWISWFTLWYQTWLASKSHVNGGFNEKIIYKCSIFH